MTEEQGRHFKNIYEYDNQEYIIEEAYYYYSDNKEIKSKRITKYQYDSKGNWIKKTEYSIKKIEWIILK